jgi:O-antigen/teichoic acid export membrane protein
MTVPRAAGGAAWTIGGFAATQVLRFGFNVALARLVAPDVFGVMALVNLLVQGLQMFSDLGIRQCVIQHPRGDEPAFLNTAWTAQAARGALLWLGSGLLAWPMAALYGEPALLWLIPLTGFGAFVTGFSSTALLTYGRAVIRGPLVIREVGVYAVTFAAVVVAVWAIHRRWPGPDGRALELAAIACGSVLTAVGGVALSFTLRAAAPHRFAWEPEAGRSLLRFGGWVFVSSALTFLAAQADRLVVGKMSLDVLGVYHIAAVIVALPAGVLAALGSHLVFPLLSRAARAGELQPAFLEAHRGLAVAAGLLITGAACVGPAFIGAVYDDRYAGAADLLRLLAVGAWFTAFMTVGEMTLLALDQTRALAVAQGARLVCLPAFMFAGFEAAGLPGFVLGVAAGEAVRYGVVAAFLSRARLGAFMKDVALTSAALVVVEAYLLAEAASGPSGRVAVPLLGALALTVFWIGVLAVWVGPGRVRDSVGRLLSRPRAAPEGVEP